MNKLKESFKFKMTLLSCLLLLLYSCEVEKIEPVKPVPDQEQESPTLPDTASNDQKPLPDNEGESNGQEKIEIGNGSGQIIIKDIENKEYVIKPGTYWNINIENVKNVSLTGLNKVTISGGDMNVRNVNGLTITGISFQNWSQNAINVFDDADNLTFENLKFKNIPNTVISFRKDRAYDGTPQSFTENIHLINIHAENVGTLFGAPGGLD